MMTLSQGRSTGLALAAATLVFMAPASGGTHADPDAAIEAFSIRHGMTQVERLDMNQSGSEEILLIERDPCGAEACAWSLYSQGDAVHRLSEGHGREIRLEATEPAGGVLHVDGVTWALMEGRLYPFGDEISMGQERAANSGEILSIQAVPPFSDITRNDVRSWTFRYLRDETQHHAHVHVITAWEHQVGHWGSPYLIFDNDGEIIAQGLSTDGPRIFPDLTHGGFTIVEVVPAGFTMQVFR